MKRSILNDDFLLLTMAGTLGDVAVFRKEFPESNINQDIAKIRLLTNKISYEYANVFFQTELAKSQVAILSNGGTRGHLNFEKIKSFIVAVPPFETQQQIVHFFNTKKLEKEAKEREAQELLASVDAFVLEKLGIRLPEAADNSLRRRTFYADFNQLSGGRFDAPANNSVFSLQSSLFPMVRLKDVAAINPYTNFSHLGAETPVSFIPMEAISDELGQIREMYERAAGECKGYTCFQENDVIWAKITPCMQNGKSAVATNLLNGYGFGSTEYHVFRPLTANLNPFFIHILFRLKYLRGAAMNFFGGSAGHQRVDDYFFKKMSIPLPPPEAQAEIAAGVAEIYRRARDLRAQGALIVADARQKVEKIILGKEI